MEWIRIPFGLRNAPPAFQRFINKVLGDMKGKICEPYLDDILVYSETFEEHVQNLRVVLTRLKEKGIKLRPNKCVFGKTEVRYLGRLLSGEGYRPDPADTIALEKFRVPPRNIGELRSLLGFLGYYRSYVKDFSKIVKPMYELLAEKGEMAGKVRKSKENLRKRGQKHNSREAIAWTDNHQRILDQLINQLQSPVIIAYPDFQLPFFITCDASNNGLGAVLYQTQGGVDKVISYASRTLSDAEKNYHLHSGKLEFLALKWAITERFSDYLHYGPPFDVFTDNNPLTYVLSSAKLNAVGMRWVNELADFQFTIHYKRGVENVDADYLSRRSIDVAEYKKLCTEKIGKECLRSVWSNCVNVSEVSVMCGKVSAEKLVLHPNAEVVAVSSGDLGAKQSEDPVIGPVYCAVRDGVRPSRKELSNWPRKTKILMKSFNKLALHNSVLVRRTAKFMQVVLPAEFHKTVFTELHVNMAHLGVNRVLGLAQPRFYWPGMAADLTNMVRKKCKCIANKTPNQIETAPLETIQTTYPMELVSIDYCHLDPCKGGFQYAMVVTDNFTKFCQIYATRTKSLKAAADKMFNNFIMEFGFPARIHSDQGGEFTGKLFRELQRLAQIQPSTTTPYHPEGNGQTERMNRTMISMLKTLSGPAKKDWKTHLSKLAFAYNSTINKATGFSPMYLMFGRESRLPIDLMFEDVGLNNGIRDKSHQQFVREWHEAMKEAMRVAQVNMEKSSGYNKQYRDRKAKIVEVNVGDHVLVRNYREKGGTGKLKSFWEEAIFEILEKKEDLPVYKVQNLKKPTDVRVLHRNKIMRCEELPLDTFDDPNVSPILKRKTPSKTSERQEAKTPNSKAVIQSVGDVEDEQMEGSEDDSEHVVIVEQIGPVTHSSEVNLLPDDSIHNPDVEGSVTEEIFDSGVEEERDLEEVLDETNTSSETSVEVVGHDTELDESTATIAYDDEKEMPGNDDRERIEEDVETVVEGESESGMESESPAWVRRSTRQSSAPKRFTYEKIGGNPTMASVDHVLASLDTCVWLRKW